VCRKLIELRRINKSYGSLKVLEDVSLSLLEGEIISLIGPSGCGKTTVLNIIAGIISPDNGRVRVAKGKRIGYVFQEPRLIPWKSVEENILFVQDNYSLAEKSAREIREKLIEEAEMKDFAHSFPSELSGGMKQRVSLLRALSIIPHILLLDEPFKSMDSKTVSVMEKIILQIRKKEHPGILLVTHNYQEALRLSNRIYVLSQRPARIVEERPMPALESTNSFLFKSSDVKILPNKN
jgi:NitT/TauT family transport system ATP-binding protein